MIRKLLIILACISNNMFGALQPGHWLSIVEDIARDGDKDSRGEFEAAKQAFLNIKLEDNAEDAAKAIEKTWKASFGTEATVGSKGQAGTLMDQTRYPEMTTNKQIQRAAVELFDKTNIADFLAHEKIKVDTSEAKAILKD